MEGDTVRLAARTLWALLQITSELVGLAEQAAAGVDQNVVAQQLFLTQQGHADIVLRQAP